MENRGCILLVDDEAVVRASLERVLANEQYRVLSAATAGEARAQSRQHQVDAAIVDVQLDDELGWNLVADLRASQPAVPIIMISASPGQRQHPLASQVNAVMEKPLDLPVLLAALGEFSGARASAVDRLVSQGIQGAQGDRAIN